jgi:toxin CcdB
VRQFGVYRNRNAATNAAYPLLLNIQSDLIAETGTRVVVPLVSARGGHPQPIASLAPIIDVAGTPHVLMVPLLAAVEIADAGPLEADLSAERSTILEALDMLISGI